MKKRTCSTCDRQWSYLHSLKIAWSGKKPRTCPYCETPQYMTARSRMRGGNYAIAVMVAIFMVRLFWDVTMGESILIAIGIFVLVFMIYPLSIQLTEKEQPLF